MGSLEYSSLPSHCLPHEGKIRWGMGIHPGKYNTVEIIVLLPQFILLQQESHGYCSVFFLKNKFFPSVFGCSIPQYCICFLVSYFIPTIIRVSTMKNEWMQESQFSRILTFPSLCNTVLPWSCRKSHLFPYSLFLRASSLFDSLILFNFSVLNLLALFWPGSLDDFHYCKNLADLQVVLIETHLRISTVV